MSLRNDTQAVLNRAAGDEPARWEMTVAAYRNAVAGPDGETVNGHVLVGGEVAPLFGLPVDIVPGAPIEWKLRTKAARDYDASDVFRIIGPGRYLRETELKERGIGSVGENVMVHETAILVDAGRIEIGSNVRIDPYCILSAAGGHIRLGSYIHIAAHADIFGGAGVEMEDFSGLSQSVKLYSISDDYSGNSLTNPTIPRELAKVKTGAVKLGRHVIIGSGSVVLPGVTVGEGSAVGALSLVTKSVGEWGIWSGVPVRRLSNRSQKLLEDEARL